MSGNRIERLFMVRRILLGVTSVLLLAVGSFVEFLSAANSSIGDVDPDITTWGNGTTSYIAHTSDGSVLITDYLITDITYIGHNIGTTGNARITGIGGAWKSNLLLDIGYFGNGALTIDTAGALFSYRSYLGQFADSIGTALVTGNRSEWLNSSSLFVGYSGSGLLTVKSRGRVTGDFYVGYFGNGILNVEDSGRLEGSADIAYIEGSTGQVTVTGDGSRWTDASFINVGYGGNGELKIEAGAHVSSSFSKIGRNASSTGVATVNGTDSIWVSGQLDVGDSGKGSVLIEAGAHMDSGRAYLGSRAGSLGSVTVTGLGSRWRSDSSLYIGSGGNGELVIDSGGEVRNDRTYIGTEGTALGTATVKGMGSTWTSYGEFLLGLSGKGSLAIESGGHATSADAVIGVNSNSTGTATVTGVGSLWKNSGALIVSELGNGSLNVANGGEVTTGELFASFDDLSGDGLITATQGAVLDIDVTFDATETKRQVNFGSGGTLAVTWDGGAMGAGYKHAGSLTIANNANINSSTGFLGYLAGSKGNATVTGTNARWTLSGELCVGRAGSGILNIEDGAKITNTLAYIGQAVGSSGTVKVAGVGSTWANSDQIYIGQYGNGLLTIEGGGQVSNRSSYLGNRSGSTGSVVVVGPGSKWTNNGAIFVGGAGTGSLTVADGGEVVAQQLFASLEDLKGNGTITVSQGGNLDADLRFDATHGTQQSLAFGSGGTLTVDWNEGVLGVGYQRVGSLVIAEGVEITTSGGRLGFHPGSSGTSTVTGSASKWTVKGGLTVGYEGAGSLAIEAGGQMANNINSRVILGENPDSTGTATVREVGSQWTSGSLVIGQADKGAMIVSSGAHVSSANTLLGNYSGASGEAIVTGTGSQWVNSGALKIGQEGTGTMSIEAGGHVTTRDGYLGLLRTSPAWTVTVAGNASQWTVANTLNLGAGDGTIIITNSALVSVGGQLSFALSRIGSSINMATGGMLALAGNANDSLSQFLGLIYGTDNIRYWNASLSDWAPLTTAIYGADYTLEYLTTGDLAGYTLLTVGTAVPEPTAWLLALGMLTISCHARGKLRSQVSP
jgi:T5SS/PEP-CTERM-associated repeat protein